MNTSSTTDRVGADDRGRGGALLELCSRCVQLGLPRLERTLTSLDGRTLELDGAELLAATSQVLLGLRQRRLAFGQAGEEVGELGLARLEVGRAQAQHPFDRRARVPEKLLAPFELGDRLAEPRGMLVELLAALREQLLEPFSPRSALG